MLDCMEPRSVAPIAAQGIHRMKVAASPDPDAYPIPPPGLPDQAGALRWLWRTLEPFRLAGILVVLSLLGGCQPSIQLMPSPIALTRQDGATSSTPEARAARNSPEVPIFYATNRQRLIEHPQPIYTVFPSNDMHFGIAHLRIGNGSLNWEDIEKLSSSSSTRRRPSVRLERLEELAELVPGQDPGTTPSIEAFFAQINAALAQTRDKNLIVYVHGANNSMHRATGQAAQFYHFTGRNSVMLSFVWPSAERLRTYFKDIRHARASIPAFTHLIEMLGAQTDARHIDVLAYSAGAEVASAGLAALGEPHGGETREQLKQRLRLGKIYFAAPDTDTRQFVTDLENYIDLAERVSLSANLNDFTLQMAAIRHRASRAGRPDAAELDPEQTRFLVEASKRLDFDLIKVYPSTIPGMSRHSHGFWYTNAWVSNDVMAAFILRYSPQERTLEMRTTRNGMRYWIFPDDYNLRITELLRGRPLHARHVGVAENNPLVTAAPAR